MRKEVTDIICEVKNGNGNVLELEKLLPVVRPEEVKEVCLALDELLIQYQTAPNCSLYIQAVKLYLGKDATDAERVVSIISGEAFNRDNRLFVFNQLKRFYLLNGEADKPPAVQNLYDDVVAEWKKELSDLLTPLPAEKRNSNRYIVLTLQVLGRNHAPTKTAFERCATLCSLGKEVFCINTREQLTMKGAVSFPRIAERSIMEEYSGVHIMEHDGAQFALIQPEVEMPDEEMMRMLLEEIREMAPWMVIVCGDRCLLGDLVAEMIPTICIPMTFSTIPKKVHEFVAVGRNIPDEERKSLIADGYDMDSVLESIFTFKLKEQTTTLTREALGLPAGKFLLGIIGIRLDAEVHEDFLKVLLECVDVNIHLVFAGKFEEYEAMCDRVEGLRENSSFIGYQEDILALWEVLDLYINPPRVGGGFSVAEAFYKEKPGISMNWGDVAASAGEEFCVASLAEYPALIRRYATDSDFYKEMGQKAKARSERLFNSAGELQKILDEAQKRKLWF